MVSNRMRISEAVIALAYIFPCALCAPISLSNIVVFSCFVLYADFLSANWGNAIFAGFNAVVTTLGDCVVYRRVAFHPGYGRRFGALVLRAGQTAESSRADMPTWKDTLYFGDRTMIYEFRPV
ncbi:hypothetical protein BTHE_2003 [Bifidobacterium thermophilum]|nr:hypothetical protein BTHE_2003 [Bifidobacterium thermophilum]